MVADRDHAENEAACDTGNVGYLSTHLASDEQDHDGSTEKSGGGVHVRSKDVRDAIDKDVPNRAAAHPGDPPSSVARRGWSSNSRAFVAPVTAQSESPAASRVSNKGSFIFADDVCRRRVEDLRIERWPDSASSG